MKRSTVKEIQMLVLNLDGEKSWTALFLEESWVISQLVSPPSSGHELAKLYSLMNFKTTATNKPVSHCQNISYFQLSNS
jgi:hypothetical protein